MTQIKTNPTSYSEHHPEDGVQNNWAAAYAKREVNEHKTAPVLDHPDGSVTEDKLSDGVKEAIAGAVEVAQTATETANNAKDIADAAKASADNAVSEAENAYDKSLDADSKADDAVLIANTAKAKSETAEQRAITAETKADAAVASASGAVQKAETVRDDLMRHSSNADIHTTAEEKEAWNNKAEKEHVHIEYAKVTDVPKKVGELENDSGYLTEHQDVSGKADKATTLAGYGITDAYTKDEIDTRIGDIDTALDNLLAIQETLIGGDGK